ncbi:protein doublesex-like isoform X4 [Vespula squamosa]|uniref:Protein doublesex-like isoform X4 n=1 Tax=Vespula squamosa TaxID=30214 RepID=A0ABD2BRM8_VESSQ
MSRLGNNISKELEDRIIKLRAQRRLTRLACTRPSRSSPRGINDEIILAYSMNLLQQFRYPSDMLTLMFSTVKNAGANLDETLRRIQEEK